MTAIQPNVHLDGRYSINETCEALGIHRHTLRKYTELGEIRSSLRRCGKIFYYGKEIIKFWRTH